MAGIAATEKQLERELESILSEVSTAFATHREALSRSPPSTSVDELTQLLEVMNGTVIDKRRALATAKDALNRARSDAAGARAILKQEQQTQQELMTRSDTIIAERAAALFDCVADLNRLRKGEILMVEFEDTPNLTTDISVDALVQVAKETEEHAYEYKSVYDSSRLFLRKVEKTRNKANGKCPCCLQGMGPDVVSVYEAQIKKLFTVSNLQGTEADYTRTVETAKALTARATALEKLVQPLSHMTNDLQASKNRVAELNPKLETLAGQEAIHLAEVTSLEATIAARDKACSALSDLRSRWVAAEQRIVELGDRKRRHTSSLLAGSLSETNEVKSIEELEEQQRKRGDRKDELIARKDKLVAEEANLTKRMYHLKNQLGDCEKTLISARQRSAKQMELENGMKARSADIERIEMEVRGLVQRKDDASRALQYADSHLKSAQADLQTSEQKGNGRMNELRGMKDTLTREVDLVEANERKLADLDFNSIQTKLEAVNASIYQKEENIRTLNPKIQTLNAELSSQENRRRQVRDNLDLRDLLTSHEKLNASLATLDRKVGGSLAEIAAAEREIERAEQEKRRLTSEHDRLEGNLQIYRRQTEELNAKLQNNNFKNIEERFRKKNIQYETTMLASSDLGLYYDALDKALQNFHLLKIKEINKIIRELWQLIYKGQDIDMVCFTSFSSCRGRDNVFFVFRQIELESGQEAGEAAATKSRRSYHYRVVMRKGDIPLDMRGRCSAGQRVLAAIVIRLALAETFCLNCGILALDEPTTNLDDANKAGLAHALARIIVSRSKQQNFQLICITHDEVC
jgi:DNA repair protein RAD50